MNASPHRDPWLCASLALLLLLYAGLLLIQPGGEGFGRGWNLIAFFLYASPAAVGAAGLASWRRGRSTGAARRLATAVALGGFVFPVLCLLPLRLKS